ADRGGGARAGPAARPAAAPALMRARERAMAAPGDAVLFPRASVAASMVIRTGEASIEVDSLEAAVSRVRLLAGRIGGYIANTTTQPRPRPLPTANPAGKGPGHRLGGTVSARHPR